MRFVMTTDWIVKLITTLCVAVVMTTCLIPFALFAAPQVPQPVMWATMLVSLGVPAILGLTVLWAPRAVRIENEVLIVERLAWSDVRIPLSEIASVEAGPELRIFGGAVRRVAGNGGLMGFTGFFSVRGEGVVRCWATRIGAPTVLVRRKFDRPVLLGVDDGSGLVHALRSRTA
jgi:hypothetical protein